ncbi:hypothetical protein GCM10017576_21550 [Microbacterium barkeri]|uniref:Uncharacterized protein n=1 Tax=Microbacterium barkeri TaxID=33917 RepID=A0A9W6H3U8_9MICO|nr:hypothetical protein [Microbacterium barkeri]MDI6944023.1 hypothetical protein [Microbacterium barkeri]MDR6876399.1 hypothetical protein [Microbacterium barkeri]GLJ62025.1 hypothetical protein GCM10017576_21550 [Microbacterium barkeri]
MQFRQDTQEFDGCHAPPRPHDLCSHRFEHIRIEAFSIAQEPGQMCHGDRAEDGADPPDLFGGPHTHDTMPYCRQHLSGIRRGLHVHKSIHAARFEAVLGEGARGGQQHLVPIELRNPDHAPRTAILE